MELMQRCSLEKEVRDEVETKAVLELSIAVE
jgi:hypothetical protein